MARSINSPGVQIIETDLSQYQQIGGATTVFVPGFAAQGPTDEVLLVSTVSELETIYGQPASPAERYFHYTCREILNSPATLLTSRLPYGSGSGNDFASTQYSALLYPVASAADTTTYYIGAPRHITLTEDDYNNILQNNVTWSGISAATVTNLSGTGALSSTVVNTLYTANFSTSGSVYSNNNLEAGIVVLNAAQTTQNEFFEGYYVTLTDNLEIGPNTDFAAVTTFKTLTTQDDYFTVPSTRLGFSLSGSKDSLGTNSISEVIEGIPSYNFGLSAFQDSLIFTVFKVRNSIYEPQTLVYSLAESYIGSLNKNRLTVEGRTYHLENLVNNSSPNVKLYINPLISQKLNWSSNTSTDPSKVVRVGHDNKSLYSTGVFKPTFTYSSTKATGSVKLKVDRALSLVEASETILLDLVVDGGLSTIAANTTGTNTEYNDKLFFDTASTKIESSDLNGRWRSIFNSFNIFAQNTRKDCMFISDPLRQIFVNGDNVKTLSVRNKTFSEDIFTPLKNLFSTVNTNYAATYGNWIRQYDAYSDNFVWLPTSGYAAAIYARTDATTQPWFAPAGLNRGIINNIVDIAFNPNQKQRDFLYNISVNPVVSFFGDGFVIFGQKTLQSKPSAFDRVNVRRLFLTLERATQRALRYFVFESNTEFTRTRLKNTIAPIFELAKNTQGLYDYLIVCDDRNNTPDVIDRNELAVDIYIKPVKAAEFILVNFIATRTGQNFQELI